MARSHLVIWGLNEPQRRSSAATHPMQIPKPIAQYGIPTERKERSNNLYCDHQTSLLSEETAARPVPCVPSACTTNFGPILARLAASLQLQAKRLPSRDGSNFGGHSRISPIFHLMNYQQIDDRLTNSVLFWDQLTLVLETSPTRSQTGPSTTFPPRRKPEFSTHLCLHQGTAIMYRGVPLLDHVDNDMS